MVAEFRSDAHGFQRIHRPAAKTRGVIVGGLVEVTAVVGGNEVVDIACILKEIKLDLR